MAFDGSTEFVDATHHAFKGLVTDYGFSAPVVDDLGREVFVRYDKGQHTVAVSLEHGSRPIVELFYPASETGERPLAWAERNGVARARRIPRLATVGRDESLTSQLERAFARLEAEEGEFLLS